MTGIEKSVSALNVRAYLAADIPDNLLDIPVAVGLDATGKAVVGAGAAGSQTGIIGLCVPTKWLQKVGAQIDIHRLGEITDLVGLAAGTKYYINAADGKLSATATAGRIYVGFTVEAYRLVLAGFAGVVAA